MGVFSVYNCEVHDGFLFRDLELIKKSQIWVNVSHRGKKLALAAWVFEKFPPCSKLNK